MHALEQPYAGSKINAGQLDELPGFLKLLEIGLYLQVYKFAQKTSSDSWVGKFMLGRRERNLAGEPFVELA